MRSAGESALGFAAVQILRYAVNKGARDKNRQAAAWAITHYERMRRKVLIEGCSLADIDAAIDAVRPRVTDGEPITDEPTPTFTRMQRERQETRGWLRIWPWH